MKFRGIAFPIYSLGLAFLMASIFSVTVNAEPAGKIMVSPDIPMSLEQLKVPSYTPTSIAAAEFRRFNKGNWRYKVHYVYGYKGWKITGYSAQRIHESTKPAVAFASRSLSPNFCGGPPTNPKARNKSSSTVQSRACSTAAGVPGPSDLPAPPTGGSNTNPGDTYKRHWQNYKDSGWSVTARWQRVANAYGPGGHWTIVHFETNKIETKDKEK